ncbi:MAG TPA: ABC transporter permease subunit [Anaerolineae bacterium]|nr:ABC transporter permease subunit [Anaerolineae bacterium]
MSAIPAPPTIKPRRSFGEMLRRNPITLKEMRSRMRGRRAFAVLTLNVFLLGLLVSLIYMAYAASAQVISSPSSLQSLGKAIFATAVGMQLLITCFTSSSAAVGAISAERERQTFELLRTTLLPARSLVIGKLAAAVLFNLLIILSAIPIASLSFFFGGVTLEEIAIASIFLIVTAIAFSTIGLFFSSLMRRTSQATAVATVVTLLLTFGLPVVMLILQGLLSTMVYVSSQTGVPSVEAEITRNFILWLLISISPLSAGVATLATMLDSQSALTMTMTLSNGTSITYPSPWITYTLIYLLLSLLLIWLSVRVVKRVDK